jgi:hypothetical protein
MADHEREVNEDVGLTDSGSGADSLVISIQGVQRVVSPWSETVTATTLPDETTVGPDATTVTYQLRITDLHSPQKHFRLLDQAGDVVQEGVGDSLMDALISMAIRLEDGPENDPPNH